MYDLHHMPPFNEQITPSAKRLLISIKKPSYRFGLVANILYNENTISLQCPDSKPAH